MTVEYVTLTLDLYNGRGDPITQGTARFTPSAQLTDIVDGQIVTQTPIVATFTSAGLPAVHLLPTDNANVHPSGWVWDVEFAGVPGTPPAFSFALPLANGAEQRLSAQAPASSVTQSAQFLQGTYSGDAGTFLNGVGHWTNPFGGITVTGTPSTGDVLTATDASDAIWAPPASVIDGVTVAGVPSAGDVLTATDASDAGWSAPASVFQPWQFLPEDHGAKGDGKVLGDVVTSGNTTITSASAAFTVADVGKHIMIHGANGATNGALITTIASVTNATTAVLTDAAGANVSNCPAVYGTDDTAAINAAVSAAGAYALANNYFAEVLFSAKTYILAAAPTQTASPVGQNSQIVLPYPDVAGSTRKLVIALTGAGDAGYCQYWESATPNIAGSALVSMSTAPSTPDATFGNQSVIGGPSQPGAFTGGYANVKAVVKGLSVWLPIWTNVYAYDFGFVSAMRVQQSSAHIFAPPGVNTSAVQPYLENTGATNFLNSIGTGFRTPAIANNDDSVMDDVTAEGYECAFRVFDHFTASRLAAIYSDVVMFFNSTQGTSSVSHGIFVQSMSAEVYNGGILTNGGTAHVDINWDAECVSPSYDINDSGHLHGIFRFRDPANARFPVVNNGAANLKIICEELGPGHWASPPAVPAASTNKQNTAWRDAMVIVSGGSGVAISVDGQTTGLSSGQAVYVPSGKNINLGAYTGTPTWQWWLF